MPFIELLTIGVGSAIAKGILKLWLKDSVIGAEVGTSLVDIIKAKTPDVIAQRRAERQFEQIGEKAAESLAPLFEAEMGQLDEGSLETVAFLVGQTLSEAKISAEILTKQNLEPSRLADSIIDSVDPAITKHFSQKELELYKRSIAEASQSIVDIASQLPQFNEQTFAEILKRENQLLEIAKQTLDEVRRITEGSKQVNPEVEAARFEAAYRLALVRNLDHMELFGVDTSTVSRRQNLSVAYITLSVKQKGSKTLISVDEALANPHRVLIRGLAGSGKTTLLRWAAVRSASQSFESKLSGWNTTIPFFVRLRQFAETQLPAPEDFPGLVALTIAGTMPKGWAHRQLETGRALVLIDGVDEVAESQRPMVRDWLRDLVKTYDNARFIVTSRPHAIESGWMWQERFVETELQPMEIGDIHSFIGHWHRAVGEELQEQEEKAEHGLLAENLKRAIKRNRPLRNLAETPLLCAMLCALHRDRRQQLPSDRIELYEAGCNMLLERRDRERRIELRGYPQLNYRRKKLLLQDFAYWLLKNGWSEVTRQRADERFGQKLEQMDGLQEDATGANVRRLFVERSGLIREPVVGQVDFAHRTFQEFLAAQAVLDEGDFGLLVKNADDDQWREVVILAAGLARPKERGELIKDLITSGDEETSLRHKLHLLAVACLETSLELDRKVKEAVDQRLSQLVPPRSEAEAKDLASAGELAVPHLTLQKKEQYGSFVTAACIRALTLISGETALSALESYGSESRLSVVEELVKARDSFDSKEYSRRILSHITDISGELGSSSVPRFIQILSSLDSLTLRRCGQLTDLSGLAGLSNLTALDLSGGRQLTDLSGLAGLSNLTALTLRRCGQLTDLSGLAGLSNLTALDLSGGRQLTDLSGLAGLSKLTALDLSGGRQLTDLSGLAGLSNLTALNLSGGRQLTDLSGLVGLSKLTALNLSGGRQLTDLSGLAGLSKLTALDLSWCGQLTDLSGLVGLSNLTALDLSWCGQLTDLSGLVGLSKLTALNLSGREQLTDLSGLAGLSKLTALDLSGCKQLTDLSGLAGLSKLTALDLSGCEQLRDLSGLAGLSNLTALDLSGCEQLRDLSGLAGLSNLTALDLSGCEQLRDLSGLAGLSNLTALDLSGCEQLRDLSGLAGLSNLTALDLSGCEQLRDLSGLAGLSNLTALDLSGCEQLRDLSGLVGLSKLTALDLSWCRQLRDLSGLVGLSKLTALDLSWCRQLRDLSGLVGLSKLTALDLSGCKQLTDLSPIEGWSELRVLR